MSADPSWRDCHRPVTTAVRDAVVIKYEAAATVVAELSKSRNQRKHRFQDCNAVVS